MSTQKIQITLNPQEVSALALKGRILGYDVTKYVKFLIMREAFSVMEKIPVTEMSEDLEKRTLKALKDHRNKLVKKLTSIEDLD